jgi:A/G-specific adenine glycosylase
VPPGVNSFSTALIHWHKTHGRHDLPWQNTTDPYRVWLSEIMLQQTQVATVIPYYARFLAHFPQLADLAAAPVDDVMALWSGLGYYARARNLHRCAQVVMSDHGGRFPQHPLVLAALPGIGRSTANSIATFCYGARAPILDGNVKRVLCRSFGIEGVPGSSALEKQLWVLAEKLMPAHDGAIYNQAQMDLGATLCTRGKPRCDACPLGEVCVARASGRQATLPQPKPRRIVPERKVTLLVLRDDAGRVLLEQRPPAGIWGGLMSLPELPEHHNAEEFVDAKLGLRLITVVPASTFVHVFTHFRLHITPLLCSVEANGTMQEPTGQWFARDTVESAALPAPVRRILAKY